MKKKMNATDYKIQYLNEIKINLKKVLDDDEVVLNEILKSEEKNFDIVSYKKKLKIREKIEKQRKQEEIEGYDFFKDL